MTNSCLVRAKQWAGRTQNSMGNDLTFTVTVTVTDL